MKDSLKIFTLKDFRKSFVIYSIGIILLLPGFILNQWIILPFYIIVTLLGFQRNLKVLIIIYVLWIFSNGGAYQYDLLGVDQANVLIVYFKYYLLVIIFLNFLIGKKRKNEFVQKIFKLSTFLLIAILFSAIINLTNPFNIITYFLIYLQWYLFGLVICFSELDLYYLKSLVALLFVIVLFNSVFGIIQSVILPIKPAPNGYVLHRVDVASGMLGIWRSQILTNLCLVASSYFLFRLLLNIGKYNFVFSVLFLLQPLLSESKTAMYTGTFFILISVILLYKTSKNEMRYSMWKIIFIGSFLGLMLYFFNVFSKSLYETNIDSNKLVESFFDKTNLSDYKKIIAYINAVGIIAPSGNAGILFGIGPLQLKNGASSKYENLISKAGFDLNSDNKLSTVDQGFTDMNTIISDLGLIGLFIFLMIIINLMKLLYKNLWIRQDISRKIFILIALELLLILSFNSFYLAGWSEPLYFIPFWIITAFISDIKSIWPTNII